MSLVDDPMTVESSEDASTDIGMEGKATDTRPELSSRAGLTFTSFEQPNPTDHMDLKRLTNRVDSMLDPIEEIMLTENSLQPPQSLPQQLHEKIEQFALTSEYQSEFLTNVSHELRTPMNAIIGMTELALAEKVSPVVQEYLDTVKSSAYSLLELLNGILDFSKMGMGKFALQSVPFKLRELIIGICRTQDIRLAAKDLRLNVEIADELPDDLIGDPRRLSQVLLNLLSNAIKFTDQGIIELELKLVELLPQCVIIDFCVRDTGIGIPNDEQARIFAPFTQVDGTSTRRHSGTGLGLTIASDLVKAMEGQLKVKSEVGKGSQFSFSVALARREPTATPERVPRQRPATAKHPLIGDLPRVNGLKVLLVEDVRANQQIVVRTLEKRGHSVEVASNGIEAVEMASRAAYDIILMDVQMPEMDGFQATAAIRAIDPQPQMPIIALTAHAMVDDRQRCMDAGMDDYLAKPLDLVRLVQVVEGASKQDFELGYAEGARDAC